MDGQTDFLPILQDYDPWRGRCPATLSDITASKMHGKGNTDLMIPLRDWWSSFELPIVLLQGLFVTHLH